jgi:hypothetical protein
MSVGTWIVQRLSLPPGTPKVVAAHIHRRKPGNENSSEHTKYLSGKHLGLSVAAVKRGWEGILGPLSRTREVSGTLAGMLGRGPVHHVLNVVENTKGFS